MESGTAVFLNTEPLTVYINTAGLSGETALTLTSIYIVTQISFGGFQYLEAKFH